MNALCIEIAFCRLIHHALAYTSDADITTPPSTHTSLQQLARVRTCVCFVLSDLCTSI